MRLALSEAIKGFGTDDPHTAEARQNLADRYWKMQKYDLAVPLYIEVSAVLRSASSLAVKSAIKQTRYSVHVSGRRRTPSQAYMALKTPGQPQRCRTLRIATRRCRSMTWRCPSTSR